MNKGLLFLLTIFFLFLLSCSDQKKVISVIESRNIVIEHEITPDPEVEKMVASYRVQLEAEMNEVIGFLEHEMPKGNPTQSLMGNFICDLLLDAINKSDDVPVDFAILNFGGLRINSLPFGNISVGHIYELLPFENYVVVLDINGKDLEEWFHKIAGGRWVISKNLELSLKNQDDFTVLDDVTVHKLAIDYDKTYRFVTVDYVANGGDKAELLVNLPRYNTEILMRDMIINEIESKVMKGEKLKSELDSRIKF